MTQKKTSDEFLSALLSGSGILVDCEFCKRTHFFNDSVQDFEEGELEDLLEKTQKNPDKYIPHSDFIEYGRLDGKDYVLDCPCNSAAKYEDLFWNSRSIISAYFKARANKQ